MHTTTRSKPRFLAAKCSIVTVICTFPHDQCEPSMHTERIFPNEELWSTCLCKSAEFFHLCVLPELVGRWYSRPCLQEDKETSSTSLDNDPGPSEEECSDRLYCYCRQPEDDREIIACANPVCPVEWFNVNCLKIKTIP